MGALSWQHLLIVLLIVLVLFGGSRLAGLGKSTGRAIKEFKDETKGLRDRNDDTAQQVPPTTTGQTQVTSSSTDVPAQTTNQTPVQEPLDHPSEPRRDA